MRILNITDLHYSPLNRVPQSRTNTFHEDIKSKLDEVVELCKSGQFNFGVLPGDIFNLKNSALYRPEDITYISQIFERTMIPWYIIPGNHDLPKSSLANKHRSVYDCFCRSTPNVHDLPANAYATVEENGVKFLIFGVPYLPLAATKEFLIGLSGGMKEICDAMSKANQKYFITLLLHTDALPYDCNLMWDSMGYQELVGLIPYVDLVALGHIHLSFPPIEFISDVTGRRQVISKPWSFSRCVKDYHNKTNEENLYHTPCYADIRIHDGVCAIDYIELKSAKSHKEIFKSESLTRSLADNSELQVKLKSIRNSFGGLAGGDIDSLRLTSPDEIIRSSTIPEDIRSMLDFYLNK